MLNESPTSSPFPAAVCQGNTAQLRICLLHRPECGNVCHRPVWSGPAQNCSRVRCGLSTVCRHRRRRGAGSSACPQPPAAGEKPCRSVGSHPTGSHGQTQISQCEIQNTAKQEKQHGNYHTWVKSASNCAGKAEYLCDSVVFLWACPHVCTFWLGSWSFPVQHPVMSSQMTGQTSWKSKTSHVGP